MRVAATLFAFGALAGCAGSGSDALSTSASSVLLATFTGILPCADCAGIRTELALYGEQPSGEPIRYALRETYIGTRQGDRTVENTGRLTVKRGSASDPNATVYRLEADRPDTRRNFVRSDDNELRLLDRELRDIKSAVPYSLYRAITLAEADSGKVIQVRPGERVTVRLASNRSTGYSWAFLSSGSNNLTRLASEYTQVVGADGKPGGDGVESWYFQAKGSGQQELRFEYRRPWERDAPAAKTTNYTIRVR
jgi:copper homeostasis protein (lipoprotein)